MTQISSLTPDIVSGLADLLVDAVDDGASVGFVWPFTATAAAAWWTASSVQPVATGQVLQWVASDDEGRVIGTVQVALGQMPNGRHRAEVKKLLVHRKARGQGLGRALLALAERGAAQAGATMLMLDTESGSPAESLYRSSGWIAFGVMPYHAAKPDGQLMPTTFFYKKLFGND